MAKKDDLQNTMAAALSGLKEEPAAPEPEKPKRRRKSHIEKDLMPEPGQEEPKKKRTRRKKDPALKKTHTFTLLLTESLYERFRATAEQQGLSMNGIATRLIKKYISLHDIDEDDLGL